jgi:hypothetical protein
MIKRLCILIGLTLWIAMPVSAQASASQLLTRINNLRASVGQAGYTTNSALAVAAQNHATWMVNSGKVSHTQDDGSGPRVRAQNAGYASNWVSENIYMGSRSGVTDAWNFWINSPIHYAGLTSPNYNNIGIGIASGTHGYAFVLVFGNSAGSLPQSASTGGNSNTQSSNSAAVVAPSYVVGVDAIGNIMHEVQAGDTIGDIALIYGYTWDILPYMFEINGITEDDVPYLEIGSVFLVPPQDGTFTPTVAPATSTPKATATATLPAKTATEAVFMTQMVAPATFVLPSKTPTPEILIRSIPTTTPPPTPSLEVVTLPNAESDDTLKIVLILAVILQIGIITFATIEFFRRSR